MASWSTVSHLAQYKGLNAGPGQSERVLVRPRHVSSGFPGAESGIRPTSPRQFSSSVLKPLISLSAKRYTLTAESGPPKGLRHLHDDHLERAESGLGTSAAYLLPTASTARSPCIFDSSSRGMWQLMT